MSDTTFEREFTMISTTLLLTRLHSCPIKGLSVVLHLAMAATPSSAPNCAGLALKSLLLSPITLLLTVTAAVQTT
jgi:hypothetical protein